MVPGIVASLHWRRAQSRAPHHLILLDVVLTTGARALAAPTHRVVPCVRKRSRAFASYSIAGRHASAT